MEDYQESTQTTTVIPSAEEAHRSKATTAMVLSIIGLALLIIPGLNLAGLVLSIIGLTMAVKNRKLAAANGFKECSNNATAYVCGLIGVIVNGAMILLVLLAVLFIIAIGVTAVTAMGPDLGQAITESAPAVQDAIEGMLPTAESMIPGLFGLL